MGSSSSKHESDIMRLADLMSYESRERALQIEVQSSRIKMLEQRLSQVSVELKNLTELRRKAKFNRFSYNPDETTNFYTSTVNKSSHVREINL